MATKKPELLVGVGDNACAIAAVKNGADAVYFGVKGYNMRDLGTNFNENELAELMKYLHKNKVKGYLALNTIIFEEELKQVDKILSAAKKAKVDAIILSDLGVLALAKRHKHKIFLSTQASVSNSLALKEFTALGVKRVILAREVNLTQMKEIKKSAKKLNVEIECFVHGAMCISVSGRCFLSHEAFGRSANRGECLQPCRRAFFPLEKSLGKEEPSAGAFFLDGDAPNFEKKEIFLEGSTILSAKDLKAISFLDKIISAGVDSLKIEGRTKPSDYVAVTTKCYREAIDAVAEKTFTMEKIEEWNMELSKVYNRSFSEGFFFSTPGKEDLAAQQGSVQTQKKVNVGVVVNYYAKAGVAEIKLFDSIKLGDKIIIEGVTTFIEQNTDSMESHHKKLSKAHQGDLVGIKTSDRVRPNDKVFVLKEKSKSSHSSK